MRGEILAAFQKSQGARSWPTVRVDRTIADLELAAEGIQGENNRRQAEDTARQRAKLLADIAADPMRTVRETEELAKHRGTDVYRQIATRLADLREALAGSNQAKLADQQARKLKTANPTLNRLTSALRAQGFLKK